MSEARDLLGRYLRQRAELGDAELVLERHSTADVRGLLSTHAPVTRTSLTAGLSPDPSRAVDAPAAAPAGRGYVRPGRPSAEALSVDSTRATGEGAGSGGRTIPTVTLGEMKPGVDAPARGATADEILALPVLDAVRDTALGCPRCGLAKTRRHVVFGEGDPSADVMVVGEAPGADEDASGRPFVGRAGKLLDLLLASVGSPRDSVYICNVLKCRPPGNRNPAPDEVEACSPYLLKQVELVRPKVILAFGNFAAHTLLGTDLSMGKLRGKDHAFRGVPVIPTYHPAALLRNPGWVRAVWDDLQRFRAIAARA
ncbi:MAG: phage polymerase-related protein [Gemmatimonadetes bacterium]|nr:phage polymerase-related protein [Gemmatimonadota bacterium]